MLVSDADRERTVLRLRAEHGRGVLSDETFERRVEGALHARRRVQLEALVQDLPRRGTALREALTTLWGPRRDPWEDAVPLPAPGRLEPPVVAGRSSRCDVPVPDPTVSARHLELRPLPGGGRWLAVDLGSLNGTWAHDRRVGRTVVRHGDVLLLGEAAVRILAPLV